MVFDIYLVFVSLTGVMPSNMFVNGERIAIFNLVENTRMCVLIFAYKRGGGGYCVALGERASTSIAG